MPEGDTIHHAALRIRGALEGEVPEEILTPHARLRGLDWPGRLAGRRLERVDAHGKHLFLRFEGELTLHSHLRMTGAWDVHELGRRWRRGRPRAWLVLRSSRQEVVQFDGPVLELMSDARSRRDPRISRLGPDIIGEDFDAERFLRRLREDDPTRPIGDALLDQRTVAGIGNMWKCEACWAAGLDPWRASAEVGEAEVMAAIDFAHREMTVAARAGTWSRPQQVYRRAGMPCARCGATILQRGQWEDNRITFWCPSCQR